MGSTARPPSLAATVRTKVFTLLQRDDVDAVIIAAEHAAKWQQWRRLLESGLHVLIAPGDAFRKLRPQQGAQMRSGVRCAGLQRQVNQQAAQFVVAKIGGRRGVTRDDQRTKNGDVEARHGRTLRRCGRIIAPRAVHILFTASG